MSIVLNGFVFNYSISGINTLYKCILLIACTKYKSTDQTEIPTIYLKKTFASAILRLDMKIYEVTDKKKYMPLLLIADEQENMIERYILKCSMYVLDDNGVKAEIAVCGADSGVLEIKNLAVLPEYRRKGYGRALIEFVCSLYKDRYYTVQVGTGDSPLTIPFYEKCGFVKSHNVKNFFTGNYDHPIYEDGVKLVDMIYLKRALNAAKEKSDTEIRYADKGDKEFWFSLDKHISPAEFAKKTENKQAYVLITDGKPAGILRYNLFWDNTPFCNLLYIEDNYQGKGYGTKLMAYWEEEMKSAGYSLVLVSTQADESAQHFYRASGYSDCGSLILPGENSELFLYKKL